MPLMSLIFSALFILFGTVIIQAFRYDLGHSRKIRPRFLKFAFRQDVSNTVSVILVTRNRQNQRRKKQRSPRMDHRAPPTLPGALDGDL